MHLRHILRTVLLAAATGAAMPTAAIAAAVNDGETIAWFPLDSDFLSIANVDGNPAAAVVKTKSDGSIEFLTYDTPRLVLDAVGNTRTSRFVRLDKARAYVPLSGFDVGSDVSSVTVELFIRGDVANVGAWNEVFWIAPNPYGDYFGMDNPAPNDSAAVPPTFYIQRRDDAGGKAIVKSNGKSDSSQVWFDGEWHHVAIVIDGTSAILYKDYGKVATLTFGTAWHGSADLFLVLGGQNGNSKLDFDEVRITKGGLAPEKFLCFNTKPEPQDGDTLLYIPFDGNMSSLTMNDALFPGATTGTPAFDASVWKENVVEWANSSAFPRDGKNLAALKAERTTVTRAINNPYMRSGEVTTATLEFFLKGSTENSAMTTWVNPVDFGTGWDGVSTTRYPLRIQVDGNRLPFLLTDTDSAKASGIRAPFSFTDGEWHHVAITIQPNEGMTETTFQYFFDYGEPQTQTLTGLWTCLKYNQNLVFGTATGIIWLDEFRVTRGVLPKAKFLRAANIGGTVIYMR
ncbi:MAG: hypothetical protein IKO40_08270 [Kiritimatiellae bacterium]|nr:hypothetical protein [Kiritimatiellia bacterium]